MAEYKIKSIKDLNGKRRTTKDYKARIGRIVKMSTNEFKGKQDEQLVLPYVRDKDGNDMSGKYLITSKMQGGQIKRSSSKSGCILPDLDFDKEIVTVTTENSIFTFERLM